MLLDDKLINDYNIENNHNIILVKKIESKQKNVGLESKSGHSNSNKNCSINSNIRLPDNRKINFNELANAYKQIPDYISFFNEIDIDKADNLCQLIGMGSFSDVFGIDLQKIKECLKDPLVRDLIKDIAYDPSLLEMHFNNPKTKKIFQNYPAFKLGFQNPQMFLAPQKFQMIRNVIKEDKKIIFESSRTGISVPPDPFESHNSNQKSQMMNSPVQIPNINSFNNYNAGKEEVFGSSGINIDYKEKYKDQLIQLKDMGFNHEESNIQALKESNGNINNALEKLWKED